MNSRRIRDYRVMGGTVGYKITDILWPNCLVPFEGLLILLSLFPPFTSSKHIGTYLFRQSSFGFPHLTFRSRLQQPVRQMCCWVRLGASSHTVRGPSSDCSLAPLGTLSHPTPHHEANTTVWGGVWPPALALYMAPGGTQEWELLEWVLPPQLLSVGAPPTFSKVFYMFLPNSVVAEPP